jgi:hypothetical protein
MAGSPVLNEGGQAAGLVIRRDADATALRPEKLREFLDGGSGAVSDGEFIASRDGGSASLLTAARPVDEHPWSAPGRSSNPAGLKWDGGAPGETAASELQNLFPGSYALFRPKQ